MSNIIKNKKERQSRKDNRFRFSDVKLFSGKDRLYNIFSSIPELECPRLILRKMTRNDAADMFEYAKSEEVTRFLLWSPHESVEYTEEYLQYVQTQYRDGKLYDWAVVLKAENKMIGTCGFTHIDLDNSCGEIGYVINPAYRGHGYADEAVKRVIEFGFEKIDLNRIEARYIVGNEASRRVMEKCGMRFEGVARGSMMIKGSFRDIGCCALLRDDLDE